MIPCVFVEEVYTRHRYYVTERSASVSMLASQLRPVLSYTINWGCSGWNALIALIRINQWSHFSVRPHQNDFIHYFCPKPWSHQSRRVFWSLLQLQPAQPLSVQNDTAKCDHAVPANTQAARQAGDAVWKTCENCMVLLACAGRTLLIMLTSAGNINTWL